MSRVLNEGDKVRVVADCKSKGLTGTLVEIHFGEYTVEFDKPHKMGVDRARFSFPSIEFVQRGNNPTRNERIAVFFVCRKEGLDMESMECPDMFMIYAESVDDALKRIVKTDYHDMEFESVLFDGRMYNIKPYYGFALTEGETR